MSDIKRVPNRPMTKAERVELVTYGQGLPQWLPTKRLDQRGSNFIAMALETRRLIGTMNRFKGWQYWNAGRVLLEIAAKREKAA